MGWMSKLLGSNGKRKQLLADKRGQGAIGINYYPQLMQEYHTSHRQLEQLFANLGELVKAGDFAPLSQALSEFKAELDGHLLSENVRLYAYLEQRLKDDPDKLQLVKGFHVEMSGIARQTVQFVRKWKDAGVTTASGEEFLQEYRQVGEILQRRIGAEESKLYPLYQPPR